MNLTKVSVNSSHDRNFFKDYSGETEHYLFLLIKSKAVFRINGDLIHVNPYTVIIYQLGTPQYFRADGETFVHDWLCFTLEEGERGFFDRIGISMDTLYHLHEVTFFTELLRMIHTENLSNNLHKEISLSAYLQLLFCKLSESIHRPTGTGANLYQNRLQTVRSLIYDNPTRKWTVPELAAELSISVSYFQHLYKAQFNISPIRDVINSRIEYAKYLLTSSNYSVAQIAKELNYASDIQFIQQFKSITSSTPSSYRKSMR